MKPLIRLFVPSSTVITRKTIIGAMHKLGNRDIEEIVNSGIDILDQRDCDCDLELDTDNEPDEDSDFCELVRLTAA